MVVKKNTFNNFTFEFPRVFGYESFLALRKNELSLGFGRWTFFIKKYKDEPVIVMGVE